MASQREVRTRIASFRNIQKITRAMEAVSAARLRRAEQRIAALRPYADAIRRMTRQAARDAGAEASRLDLLARRDDESKVGILLVTADRGLAGAFNSQIIRAGLRLGADTTGDGGTPVWFASGRRGVSSLTFRGNALEGAYTGFTDRPSYADARRISDDLIAAFVDRRLDRVEVLYNGYVSPLTQRVTRETLLPIAEATVLGDDEEESEEQSSGPRPLVEYEPDAEELLRVLLPDYVEISLYRALLESTASEHGARMTAMRSASENAGELIEDLALEMNRARQAEITQEIMEVVAGAESLV
ncbi:MAG TPA: ATP synthase F1 subunit gamma [Solirubrobacteraceae bacterium]|jgi:F-type H+-transporting ATPase subunit gamma|nr:ATP synthase F1 subunit gamma [Solirubrobacteraceae bacterium]